MVLEETVVDKSFVEMMNELRGSADGASLLAASKENVAFFSEHMLGIRLYAWQVMFLSRVMSAINGEYPTKEFCAITSRQIGKSTAIAILSLWACVFNAYPGTNFNNTVVGIVSASDTQAKKLLYEIKKLMFAGDIKMAEYLDGDTSVFGKNFFTQLLDEHAHNNTTTISFKTHSEVVHGEYVLTGSKSGSVIKSYPPTAVVLGETFTIVVIDEAGKSDRISDQFFYDYAYPTGNSTDAIRVYTSTPWSPSGFFYRMVDPNDDYDTHPSDRLLFSIDAIKLENGKYFETVNKIITSLNEDGKTDEVQRAYYCRFVKGEQVYFDPEKVFGLFDGEYQSIEEFSQPCDLGVDFGGQTTSRTVLTVSYLDDRDEVVRLYDKIYEVGADGNLIADIADLKKSFNIQRIIPDECPQGDYLIREMIDKGWDVQPMNFRKDKVKKYGAFRAMLNRSEIHSYPDKELQTEMLALENSKGSRQSVIMHAPGYSDDRIDSFLLSCYFFLSEESGFNYYDLDDYEEDEDDSDGWFSR